MRPGELVDLLLQAGGAIPSDDWTNLASYIAFAIGGQPPKLTPSSDPDRIPLAGIVAATEFIEGRTTDKLSYFELLGSRLLGVIDSGAREDFLIAPVASELSRIVTISTTPRARMHSRRR